MKAFTKKQQTLLVEITRQFGLIPCMITPCEIGYSISAKNIIGLSNLHTILKKSGLNLSINDTDNLLLVYV